MVVLQNYPNLNQLSAKTNPAFDCVPTSLLEGLIYLTGKTFTVDDIMNAVYGPNYHGFTSASAFVPFFAEQGVRLFAIDGNGTQLVQNVHQQIKDEHPVIATEPDVYALAHPDWSHVISFYSESPGSLTARDPFGAHDVTHTDAEWAQLFEFNEIWSMEKLMANTIPQGWQDDGHTLRAPNGVPVVLGFREFVIANGWHPDNWPLGPQYHTKNLEDSNPSLGEGDQLIFRWSMLGYTASQGVFLEWLGQELVKARQQVASLYTMVKQLQGQPAQPPAPDPIIGKLKDRLTAAGLQMHQITLGAQALENTISAPIS